MYRGSNHPRVGDKDLPALCEKTRNPKSERNKKCKTGKHKTAKVYGSFDFEFSLSFGFRISSFLTKGGEHAAVRNDCAGRRGNVMGIYDRDYVRREGSSFLGALGERGRVCKWLVGI